jgi:Sec-independent protein translocase protein TatA
MLGDVGLPELLVIFIIVLVLFGPGNLPDIGKNLLVTPSEASKKP